MRDGVGRSGLGRGVVGMLYHSISYIPRSFASNSNVVCVDGRYLSCGNEVVNFENNEWAMKFNNS